MTLRVLIEPKILERSSSIDRIINILKSSSRRFSIEVHIKLWEEEFEFVGQLGQSIVVIPDVDFKGVNCSVSKDNALEHDNLIN